MPAPVDDDGDVCPVIRSLQVVGSMWRMAVIRYLLDGPKGFNELLRTMPGLSAKTLSRTLKHLQMMGLVERRVVSTQPFMVEYSLTKMGMELKPVIDALRIWGSRWTAATPLPRAEISEPYKVRARPSR
jgi:DNA-binding HxlR family transcriptional regulator